MIMAVSTRSTESLERRVAEKCDSVSSNFTAANQDTHIRTNDYVLNKVQALKKKLRQCDQEHLVYEMKQNRNFVMKFSPAAYELAKLVVVENLYKEAFFKLYFIESCINEDECRYQVGSIFRIFNRKKDHSKGNYLKFTINFYHTTSSVLVNGNRVDIFENELFESVCSQISNECAKLDVVNDRISSALSEIGSNDTKNPNSPNNKLKSIKGNPATECGDNSRLAVENCDDDNGLDCVAESSQVVRGSVDNDIGRSDVYNCPACDQVAGNDTIVCDECDEWFHFQCVGVDQHKVKNIPEDNPFICIFCNDRLINSEKETNSENVNTDTIQEPDITILSQPQGNPDILARENQTESLSNANERSQSINLESSIETIQVPLVPDKHSVSQAEKKNARVKKQNASSKKQMNSDNNDTLIAQKYYISSLENKVNHLENIVSVLQKSLENKNSSQDFNRNTASANITNQGYVDETIVRLLENRIHILENQTVMLNNLYIQSQTQMVFRERQLLMNAQLQAVQLGPTPTYAYSPFMGRPPPYGYFQHQPVHYQQFYQHGMPQPVHPAYVPVVNVGPQYVQPRIPVSVPQSDGNTQSLRQASQSQKPISRTQQPCPPEKDSAYERKTQSGKGRRPRNLNNVSHKDNHNRLSHSNRSVPSEMSDDLRD